MTGLQALWFIIILCAAESFGTFAMTSTWRMKMRMGISINRIRLEFKGRRECQDLSNKYGINRIRLEFEVHPKIKSFVEKYLY